MKSPSRPAPARSVAADGFAPPTARRLLDQLTRVLAAHVTGLRKLVGQGIRPLGRHHDRAEGNEPEALDRVEDRAVVIGGHAAWCGAVAA